MNAQLAPALISIVTPSFNQGAFLSEALGSLLNQSYPDVEHLVLDGGSTDDSRNLLESLPEESGGCRLWWRSCKDDGQSAALNEGFARATGDIVGWLNADDRYRRGCLANVATFFAEHPEVDVAYGDYTFIDEAGEHISLRREIEFSRFVLRYHRVLYIPTAATFFRRRVFDEGNFLAPSLHYAMDLEFFLRLSDAGYRFQHIPSVLADVRIHPGSKSVAFRGRQRAEHRSVVLNTTPLARYFGSKWMRERAAGFLAVWAAVLRYSEKLRRGYYLPFERWASKDTTTARPQEQS